jgi:hypothetical protein
MSGVRSIMFTPAVQVARIIQERRDHASGFVELVTAYTENQAVRCQPACPKFIAAAEALPAWYGVLCTNYNLPFKSLKRS